MPSPSVEELLAPVSGENAPCGRELGFEEWDSLKSIRFPFKSQDLDDPNKVQWKDLRQLAGDLLANDSKDLRIAAWFAEASSRIDGLAGVSTGLELVAGLIDRYWDSGLFPVSDDGDHADRAEAIGGMSEALADVLASIPFASRSGGSPYSLVDHRNGSKELSADVAQSTTRAALDGANSAFQEAHERLKHVNGSFREKLERDIRQDLESGEAKGAKLEKAVSARLDATAPDLGAARDAFEKIEQVIGAFLKEKGDEETPGSEPLGGHRAPDGPASVPNAADAWATAEAMIRSGKIDEGLYTMSRLANTESRGRTRFHRKLQLAEACIAANRDRLAEIILQELNQQIAEHKLDQWESPELIGRVWSRLYTVYRRNKKDSEANDIYLKLSHLDPWQVLEIPGE